MKKLMTTIFLTALFMLCAIGLAACENGNTTGINIKSVQGEKGEKGDDGTGIKNIEIDSDGNLIVTLTDDKTINAGNVKLGHPHEIKEKEVVISEPTCNTMGLKYVICETCGEVVKTILTEHTVHSILNENETCEHCGWTVTSKKGDNFLMENDNGELKAEFYGKKFYDFGDDVRDKYVSVYIGEKITEIDDKAFLGCKELTSITVNENNKKYQSIDGNLYSKDGKSLIKYAIGKTDTKFIIPKGVVNIGYAAFNECSSLKEIVIPDTVETIERGAFRKTGITSIVIPDSVTSIGGVLLAECSELRTAVLGKGVTVLTESMFFKCQNLLQVELPDNITAIETEAFAYCPSLSNVLIPHKVTKLGNACFYGCTGLSQIIIPASVEEMGNNVFYGCKNLKDVKVMPVIPPQIHEGTFANTSSELKIYCLADSLDVYKTELFWKEYANKIVTL